MKTSELTLNSCLTWTDETEYAADVKVTAKTEVLTILVINHFLGWDQFMGL